MNSSMRPELTACVDNSASLQTRPSSLIYRGLTVQTNRATSNILFGIGLTPLNCTATRGGNQRQIGIGNGKIDFQPNGKKYRWSTLGQKSFTSQT